MNTESLDNIVVSVDYFNHRICSPTWCIEDDYIDFVDITYVISGQAEYIINGKRYLVSSGDLITIPAGSRRSATSCPDALMECFSVNGIMRNINGEDITLPFPIICNIGLHKEIIDLYSDLNTIWQLKEPGYILKARTIYMMILYHYFQLILYHKNTNRIDKRIQKALHYMSNHYNEALTVQGMAELVNLSDMYFGWLFKKETGMTFHKFLTSIRMNRAEEMLCSGEYKINEVAYACGFSDVFYFSRIFKEYHGHSPSNAVQAKRNKNSIKM